MVRRTQSPNPRRPGWQGYGVAQLVSVLDLFWGNTDIRSTEVFTIKGHSPSMRLKHEPAPWCSALGSRCRKVGWWNESSACVPSSRVLLVEAVEMRL